MVRSTVDGTAAAATRRMSIVVFAVCSAAMIAEGFDTYAVGFVGPTLVKSWRLSPVVIGQLYSVGVVASLFGSIAIGALADWLGRRWLLTASTLVFGVATIGSALSPNLGALMLTRILAGVGLGASVPCAIALATQKAGDRFKATVPVLMSTFIGAGVVVASLTAAAVMPRYGWRGLMFVGATFPIALSMVMAFTLPPTPQNIRPRTEADRAARWRTLREPGFLLISFVVTLGLTATYTVTFFFGFWLPTLVGSAAHNVRAVGLSTALIKTFSIFGSLTLGRLMDRYGSTRALPWAFVSAGLVLVTAVDGGHDLGRLILCLGAASFFLDGAFSGIVGFTAMAFPDQVRGTGVGVTIGVGRLIGGTLGPLLGGLLLSAGLPIRLICGVFAAPLMIAAFAVVIAGRLGRRRAAASPLRPSP